MPHAAGAPWTGRGAAGCGTRWFMGCTLRIRPARCRRTGSRIPLLAGAVSRGRAGTRGGTGALRRGWSGGGAQAGRALVGRDGAGSSAGPVSRRGPGLSAYGPVDKRPPSQRGRRNSASLEGHLVATLPAGPPPRGVPRRRRRRPMSREGDAGAPLVPGAPLGGPPAPRRPVERPGAGHLRPRSPVSVAPALAGARLRPDAPPWVQAVRHLHHDPVGHPGAQAGSHRTGEDPPPFSGLSPRRAGPPGGRGRPRRSSSTGAPLPARRRPPSTRRFPSGAGASACRGPGATTPSRSSGGPGSSSR